MKQMSDLKPCPFCGEEAFYLESYGGWYAQCVESGRDCPDFTGGTTVYCTKEEAAEAWNTRHLPPEVEAVLELIDKLEAANEALQERVTSMEAVVSVMEQIKLMTAPSCVPTPIETIHELAVKALKGVK